MVVIMTDDDVNKWEQEVFSDGPASVVHEVEWAQEQLIAVKKSIDNYKGRFAMAKFARREDLMKESKDEISKLRDMRGYLELRIEKLQGGK